MRSAAYRDPHTVWSRASMQDVDHALRMMLSAVIAITAPTKVGHDARDSTRHRGPWRRPR
ncbi:hypothetical protein AZG88_43550 [Rhodococcus sp. LB1]|nr:hypothetical protein AZG88_43550 [Rhodococcus sp. LB1]